jgi:hypothetical protein
MSQPEFVDVVTESTTFSAVTQEEFVTVKTESSLSDSPSLSSNHSLPSPVDLIKLYDTTFTEADQYERFVNLELKHWKDTVEFKYFNHLYKEHRNLTASITSMREQAMKLLELASQTQATHNLHLADLHKFLPSIPNDKLRRKLFKPAKVPPKPLTLRRIARHHNLHQAPIPRPSTSTRTIRCFQCNSPNHIKWYCVQYRCPHCRKVSPGHSMKNCPVGYNGGLIDYDGNLNIDGYFDGNGEC